MQGRKEVEFSILRSAIASTSHLKTVCSAVNLKTIEQFENKIEGGQKKVHKRF